MSSTRRSFTSLCVGGIAVTFLQSISLTLLLCLGRHGPGLVIQMPVRPTTRTCN